jgi:transcriptional regulator with XRE-family HTH domain
VLSKKLVTLRGKQTQQEVADAIGISRARYSHYETGRSEPDIATIVKIANYFGVTVDSLIDDEHSFTMAGRITNPSKLLAENEISQQIRELVDISEKLPDNQLEAILNIAKAMQHEPIAASKVDPPIKDLPLDSQKQIADLQRKRLDKYKKD